MRKMKRLELKSLKMKLLIAMIAMVLIAVSLLGGISVYMNYMSVDNTLEETLSEVANQASIIVSSKIQHDKNNVQELGLNTIIASLDATKEEKIDIIAKKMDMYDNYKDVFLIDSDGNRVTAKTDISDNVSNEEYFIRAMNGEIYLSDSYYNNDGGETQVHFVVSAPIWKDGIRNSSIEGVIAIELAGEAISSIVSTIKVGDGGYGFMLDGNLNTIAHVDYDRVLRKENVSVLYENDGSFKELTDILKKMYAKEITFGSYEMDGDKKLLSYSPIEGTNGWGMLVNAPRKQYMGSTQLSLIITVVWEIVLVLISIFVGRKLSQHIADPINKTAARLNLLSEKADLDTEVEVIDRNDEVGLLTKSLDSTISTLRAIILDISEHLEAMENGDMTRTVDMEYIGGFASIKESITKLLYANNYLSSQIQQSASQIGSGAEQVAAGAQVLSQGSTEQAGAIQELAATMDELSEQTKHNAANAEIVRKESVEASIELKNGNEQMGNMSVAINKIKETSIEISKIIKTIDDIAFQTNILALNAAVEAARAGAAGKGFAVVADEVRNLASKSAEAAKDTTRLIEDSLIAVENGVKIADKTEESFKAITEKVTRTITLVEEISEASVHQAESTSQVLIGIEQISSVVQTNSATAEESAAASEELSGQAQILMELLDGIKVKENI